MARKAVDARNYMGIRLEELIGLVCKVTPLKPGYGQRLQSWEPLSPESRVAPQTPPPTPVTSGWMAGLSGGS